MRVVNPIRNKADIAKMKLALGTVRDRLMFVIGVNSALRISDILKLKVADVIDESGTPKTSISIQETKTKKTKAFKLNRSILEELARLGYKDRGEYLFASRKGDAPISRVQAYRVLSEAAKVIGLEAVGTHSLRKTFAYHAYKAGTPLATIQKILNHSSQAETLRYIGITQDEIDDVYDAVCL